MNAPTVTPTETTNFVIPSNPKDRERIKAAVKEASDCMTRIAAEKDEIKAIADVMQEELEIPKKFFNKLVRAYFKSSFDEEVAAMEDFESLYTAVIS